MRLKGTAQPGQRIFGRFGPRSDAAFAAETVVLAEGERHSPVSLPDGDKSTTMTTSKAWTTTSGGSDSLSPSSTSRPGIVLLDGSAEFPPDILGNKGFGINAMRRLGLNVPPAFCITTDVVHRWSADPDSTLDDIWPQVREGIAWLQGETSRTFGAGPRPLLVSVRSGAAVSMPGMLDTILNLGLNDLVESALAEEFSPSFAPDTGDRFRQLYRRIVLKDEVAEVPGDPDVQLRGAVDAVLRSWSSDRAVAYRRHHGLDDLAGTAVVVQAMVFGNKEVDSGTGVLFSRDPRTGGKTPFGEWLGGGQGEDVVAGTADVEPVAALAERMPNVYSELLRAADTLERAALDVQDIEFTVEDGRLWLLQTRSAKRSPQAAVRWAVALHHEGLIDESEALRRVTPDQVRSLLSPGLQPETRFAAELLATGVAASPGVASGRAYVDIDEAIDAAERDEDVILVRGSTCPSDVQGMFAARAIVTEIGGATSHAAVVSRELPRPAVVGCGEGTRELLAGRLITVDGTHGEIRDGILELTVWSESDSADLEALREMAIRRAPLRAHPAGDYPVLPALTDAAILEAIDAGVRDVVSESPLLTMLTAIHLTSTTGTTR